MSTSGKFYQPRQPEDSPFFKVLEANFDSFELNFPVLFQPKYGFWRPVIRKSLEKFMKCGDLREGFAIVRCKDCGDEKFVAFSCKQRSCCPSCDKKRSIILGRRLTTEIIQPVAHRQWVFTIPKRLRIFYRMDRRLLGKLSRCAYETMRELFRSETGNDTVLPGMFSSIQTFGDLLNWHCHIH
ncbi:MAG: transposase zinc-binding domain-containing protein [Fibrobacteres bacterium]|nr:transposase zinc-binding domain-containing protein [Fibrobacterota bacterium]